MTPEERAKMQAITGAIAMKPRHARQRADLDALATLTAADVRRTIDRSLQRLRMERLDLVQFHWWDYDQPRWRETAQVLAALQADNPVPAERARAVSAAKVALTAHLIVPMGYPDDVFFKTAHRHLHDAFDISHATLQVTQVAVMDACHEHPSKP